MTHLLLGAILAVLVYTLIFRPWRAARAQVPRPYQSPGRWLFPLCVCLAMGVPVVVIAVGALLR